MARPWSPLDRAGVGAIAPRWRPRARPGRLAPGHIHLWVMDIDLSAMQPPDPGAARKAPRAPVTALLSEAEWARAGRLRERGRRAMYLGGRIGMRLLLSAYTGIANEDLRFGYGPRNKPALLNRLPDGELCFNYSLSGGKALYALAWNRQLGIDLETWPRKINAAALAKRKLAAVEQQAWRAVPRPWREHAMLACWTRKEAYGKALGVGIRYTLNQAPVFVEVERPVWRCGVSGLFGGQADARTLHGVQLLPPFPGIAALVHDGDALQRPADGVSLQGWRWTPPGGGGETG